MNSNKCFITASQNLNKGGGADIDIPRLSYVNVISEKVRNSPVSSPRYMNPARQIIRKSRNTGRKYLVNFKPDVTQSETPFLTKPFFKKKNLNVYYCFC